MEKERLRAISKSLTQVLFYPDTNITISVYGFNQVWPFSSYVRTSNVFQSWTEYLWLQEKIESATLFDVLRFVQSYGWHWQTIMFARSNMVTYNICCSVHHRKLKILPQNRIKSVQSNSRKAPVSIPNTSLPGSQSCHLLKWSQCWQSVGSLKISRYCVIKLIEIIKYV